MYVPAILHLLTHFPMELFHPIIALERNAWLPTLTPESSVVRSMRTPASTTHPGPMTAGSVWSGVEVLVPLTIAAPATRTPSITFIPDSRVLTYVRPDDAVATHSRSGIDEHIASDVGSRCEFAWGALAQAAQVHAHAGQIVLRLPDVHPIARQHHRIELPLVGHDREDFFLNGRRPQRDAVQDRRVEDVHASVNVVTDECLRRAASEKGTYVLVSVAPSRACVSIASRTCGFSTKC